MRDPRPVGLAGASRRARARRRSPPAPRRARAADPRDAWPDRQGEAQPARSAPGPRATGPGRPAAPARPSASTRASRRESWSSISASRPATSGSPRHLGLEQPRRAGSPRRRARARISESAEVADVALVEDQVERRQHRRQPLGQALRRRHLVGDPGVADLALRPRPAAAPSSPRETRKARAISAVRQPAERPQRQRHPRLRRQRRVAAGEDQAQPVVGSVLAPRSCSGSMPRVGSSRSSSVELLGRGLRSRRSRSIALVARDGRDPGARVGGDALPRPALERDDRTPPGPRPRRGRSRRGRGSGVATARPDSRRNRRSTDAAEASTTLPGLPRPAARSVELARSP